ncbi:SLC13 family permease [Methanobrevibacter sp.]|uniref:SLC13 family permease n=1 Tax=Methanobrevibacter sp. TaxID=66852 RepID=UPI00388E053C
METENQRSDEDIQSHEDSFDMKRRISGAILGPLCAIILWFLPIQGLSDPAHHLLAIMALVSIWWITEPVPIPVTSLLGPTLCVVLDVVPMKEAFANFANPIIFLFMGSFLIATAMIVNGLDKRIAYGIISMRWVGDSPRRIFLAIGLVCMIGSSWVSNTATAAMMFPIALGILEAIRELMAKNGKKMELTNYKYATGLMLMIAYACSIGGVFTPIGTPSNLIMMGFLEQLAPNAPSVSFIQWMMWGFVAMVAFFILTYVILWRMYPADENHIKGTETFIQDRVKELGKWTKAQKNTLFAFTLTVILWVAPAILTIIYGPDAPIVKTFSMYFPEHIVALVGGLLLFFLPVNLKKGEMTLSWKNGVEGIDWSTLLLFGGGLSLGGLMYTTGLSNWMGAGISNLIGSNPSEIIFIAVFCIFTLLLTEFTSNTASTNLIGPIAITTAMSLGFSPIPVAVGIAMASSLGFMMPVSTPPNAIVYSSGYVPITKMIKTGAIIDFIGILFITIPIVLVVVGAVMGL